MGELKGEKEGQGLPIIDRSKEKEGRASLVKGRKTFLDEPCKFSCQKPCFHLISHSFEVSVETLKNLTLR